MIIHSRKQVSKKAVEKPQPVKKPKRKAVAQPVEREVIKVEFKEGESL